MPDSGAFLVVQCNPTVRESLTDLIRNTQGVVFVGTVAEALGLLEERRAWAGAIVDVDLPDGSGLAVLQRARSMMPLLPILMLTEKSDVETINEIHEHRAELIQHPFAPEELSRFVRRAASFERVPDESLLTVVDGLAKECRLTPRETEILVVFLAHGSREKMLAELRVTKNTLKSQVKRILQKTGHDSLQSLAKAVLRDALPSG